MRLTARLSCHFAHLLRIAAVAVAVVFVIALIGVAEIVAGFVAAVVRCCLQP